MDEIKIYDNKQIRSVWDNEKEEWYFSIVDVVGVLTESENPNNYWKVLKKRLKDEGSESVTYCNQLKMKSHKDGKMYKTDVADIQGIFRIIQSIPSPKAEPFKMWLAEVGKELTDAWDEHGIEKGREYAILTDEITKAWSGMTTRRYKDFKGLKKENLRDNMTTTEIILNMLAETATKEITNASNPQGLEENKKVAKEGGSIAGDARKAIEEKTGKAIITSKNAIDMSKLIGDIVKDVADEKASKKDA